MGQALQSAMTSHIFQWRCHTAMSPRYASTTSSNWITGWKRLTLLGVHIVRNDEGMTLPEFVDQALGSADEAGCRSAMEERLFGRLRAERGGVCHSSLLVDALYAQSGQTLSFPSDPWTPTASKTNVAIPFISTTSNSFLPRMRRLGDRC